MFSIRDVNTSLKDFCKSKKKRLESRNREKKLPKFGELSVSHLIDIYQNRQCAYCQVKCNFLHINSVHSGQNYYATIDRVNPLYGYYDENIVIACYRCNQKKGAQEQWVVKNHRALKNNEKGVDTPV